MERQAARFQRPISFLAAGMSHSVRGGILLRSRKNRDSPWQYGEASPVSPHSQESVDDCWNYLMHQEGTMPPAIKFANNAIDSWQEILGNQGAGVRSNATLGLSWDHGDIEQLFALGYQIFKIKVSLDTLLRSIEEMQVAIKKYPNIQFRLDANESLSPADYFSLEEKMSGLPIDYIEDPFLYSEEYLREQRAPKFKIAIDRGLNSLREIETALAKREFDVAVLKPTTLGSFLDFERAVSSLKKAGKRIVITTSLEAEVGRATCIYLASKYCAGEVHGLSTGRFYTENFFDDRANHLGAIEFSSDWSRWVSGLSWETIA